MGRTATTFTRARERWHRLPRWVRWPAWGVVGLGVLGVLAFTVLWFTVDLPEDPPELQSAVVLSADGQELAVLSKGGQRFEVPLEEVAPLVVDALLSAEDRRFYSHSGLDPIGIARALWSNVRHSGTQGGSTLTQQLVKNQYLTSERTIWRKAREAVLAAKLERTEDKDQILERYLNTVYFGRGAYGIEAAARIYFDTTAAQLDLPQSALLVGLLRAPESADPAEDMAAAEKRRAVVLSDMVANHKITKDEAEAADATPITASEQTSPVELTAGLAPHFVEWIRQQTIDAVGEDALYSNGLKVVTTLDLKAQAAAEAAIKEVITDPAAPQAALVALDLDGAIRAHVGGRDFNALQVDLARGADGGGSGRQPGSTFKPFVLEAALEKGITLGDRYAAPPTLDLTVDGQPWNVSNYGGESFGDMTVADATAHSVNTVYAQLLTEVGPPAVADAAKRMGIDAELDVFPSIALGVEEVSPLDLASAYLTLADDGTGVEPYAIVRIEDGDGKVLWEPDRPEPKDGAIDKGISRAVTHALRGVIDGGTGTAADIGRPAAGKTGTTQDSVDAWFAGYVPGYAAVVWMGYPDGATPMENVQGRRTVTGGSFPAQIWQKFMTVAMEGRDEADFPDPPAELLKESAAAELSVAPPEVDPGGSITVSGSGFDLCRASWSVAVEGTPLASTPETGSDADERSATIQLPADIAPGSYQVVARCDSGAGERTAGSATFVVRGPTTTSTESTTTTAPDATTTTTRPGNGNTTTTSSSTTSPSTTTTTAPSG
ncbi:MAG TPA: PBP1A family penicillin-binding protein [Acidimicrobiales bacterium]|nr:PBP1A family penicillin-binding protein [Acidimicrobiales bacterium]